MKKLLILSAFLSGCASTQVVSKIPLPSDLKNAGEIKVCRERVFGGDAAATIVSVDRRPVFRSAAGRCFAAKLPSGEHVVSVMMNGWAGLNTTEINFNLKPGEIRYFNVDCWEITESTRARLDYGYEYFKVQE
ncbi:MAG: hypothetical protein PHD01_02700 [Geobacteraceae bacterium]|nr:hypothetical protein [Geobacteraceae bacterium]